MRIWAMLLAGRRIREGVLTPIWTRRREGDARKMLERKRKDGGALAVDEGQGEGKGGGEKR